MPTATIDYAALFEVLPSPLVVLGPDLTVHDVNQAFLQATGRTRADLVGRDLFDVFPQNPADPGSEGPANLNASLQRVLAFRQPDVMAWHKYDIPDRGQSGAFVERWWSPVNVPVLGADGTVAWIVHRTEDVTAYVRSRRERRGPGGTVEERGSEAELHGQIQRLQQANQRLQQSHAWEREVALRLQEAMLYSPDLPGHEGVAVRYLPATGTLNVCGDWYDVTDVSAGRYAAAVGDVVGHGLEAAAVMGMLRSALSAAMRATDRPARALAILGLYAGSVEGAETATAVKVLVDTTERLITYSSAGHPPPVLVHADGSHDLLDQATDAPLATRPEHLPRPEASLPYAAGDSLVLYTDGLVERRGEDIDVGLDRLVAALSHCAGLDPERLADDLLARCGVSAGAPDDIALVVIRL